METGCWEGLRTIGDFVTANGFVELVRARNQMAKALGYLDYYDYKVTQAEGFGKLELFTILDTLEQGTRPLMLAARESLAANKGADSLQPWNTGFAMAGDITKKLDPFFPCVPMPRPAPLPTRRPCAAGTSSPLAPPRAGRPPARLRCPWPPARPRFAAKPAPTRTLQTTGEG